MRRFYFIIFLLIITVICFCSNETVLNQYLNYGRFYFNSEKYEKSIEYFEKVLELDGFNQIAIDYLSKISTLTDYSPSLEQTIVPSVKNKKGEGYQWYINGMLQMEKKDYKKAASAFIKAYQIDPFEEAYKIMTFKSKRLFELEEHKKMQKKTNIFSDLDIIFNKIKDTGEKSEYSSYQWYLKAKFEYNKNDLEKTLKLIKISLLLDEKNKYAIDLMNNIIKKQNEEETKTLNEKKEKEKSLEKERLEKEKLEKEKLIVKAEINEINEEIKKDSQLKQEQIIHASEKKEKKKVQTKNIKLVSNKEKITLKDHISKNNNIIAGLYELDEKGIETKKEIRELFIKSEQSLQEKKFAESINYMQKAYEKGLKYNPNDIRALYYLYIIAEKKQDINNMKKYFFTLIKTLSEKRYKKEEYYIKSKNLIDSLIYTMIIQGAYNAYVLRTGKTKLKMNSLISEGYLDDYNKRTILLDFENFKGMKWKFNYINSKNDFILQNKIVISRQFGKAPFFFDEFYISEH